jgi:hypothetical protein
MTRHRDPNDASIPADAQREGFEKQKPSLTPGNVHTNTPAAAQVVVGHHSSQQPQGEESGGEQRQFFRTQPPRQQAQQAQRPGRALPPAGSDVGFSPEVQNALGGTIVATMAWEITKKAAWMAEPVFLDFIQQLIDARRRAHANDDVPSS